MILFNKNYLVHSALINVSKINKDEQMLYKCSRSKCYQKHTSLFQLWTVSLGVSL